jgi:hypothetical protein
MSSTDGGPPLGEDPGADMEFHVCLPATVATAAREQAELLGIGIDELLESATRTWLLHRLVVADGARVFARMPDGRELPLRDPGRATSATDEPTM